MEERDAIPGWPVSPRVAFTTDLSSYDGPRCDVSFLFLSGNASQAAGFGGRKRRAGCGGGHRSARGVGGGMNHVGIPFQDIVSRGYGAHSLNDFLECVLQLQPWFSLSPRSRPSWMDKDFCRRRPGGCGRPTPPDAARPPQSFAHSPHSPAPRSPGLQRGPAGPAVAVVPVVVAAPEPTSNKQDVCCIETVDGHVESLCSNIEPPPLSFRPLSFSILSHLQLLFLLT
jgi:hypothetical protein